MMMETAGQDMAAEASRFVVQEVYRFWKNRLLAGRGSCIALERGDALPAEGDGLYRDRQGQGSGQNALLFPVQGRISKQERRQRNRHHSLVVWFTGLSGAGKTTLARALEERLFQDDVQSYVLDGDNIRGGLNQDLDFSPGGRRENIRRIGEVAKLLVDAGIVAITAFISPYSRDRLQARQLMEPGEFVEVYVKCSLATCEKRDVKGLYARARQGTLRRFTGVDDAYEAPEQPEIVVDTEAFTVEECVGQIYRYLLSQGKLLRAAE